MKKTLIAASLFLAASSSTLTSALTVVDFGANAQLAFANTQLAVANGLLVSIRGGVSGTVQQIQGVRAGQEASIKQVDQYQEDTDKRNRLREGLSETLRRDLDALPTIQQCVEMTNRTSNSGALQASLSGGGGGGGRSTPGSLSNAQSKIVSAATAQAAVLKNVVEAKTCAGGMDDAIAGCSGAQTYAGADVNMSGLKRNYASKDANNNMNSSFNAEGMKAAETNAKNSTLYGAPPEVELDKAKKNPSYVSVYKPVVGKLNAAYEAMMEVALFRKAPTALPSGIAATKWNETKPDYQATFGIAAPAIPSIYEIINFAVMRDFAGPPKKEETKDPIKLAQELNEKIVLSNVIAMHQLKLTETNNILLAHLLTQSVTPTNVENVKAEAAKTRAAN